MWRRRRGIEEDIHCYPTTWRNWEIHWYLGVGMGRGKKEHFNIFQSPPRSLFPVSQRRAGVESTAWYRRSYEREGVKEHASKFHFRSLKHECIPQGPCVRFLSLSLSLCVSSHNSFRNSKVSQSFEREREILEKIVSTGRAAILRMK